MPRVRDGIGEIPMPIPLPGLSLMLEDDYRVAALPLFEEGGVEILEWSFDIGWGEAGVPEWAEELIDYYSGRERLLGHGVTFSPLSGAWSLRQAEWLENCRRECGRRRYEHVSEHFGFMTAGSFHRSAPLPAPRSPETLRLGRERLLALREAAGVPVGLENLAFAFGPRDVEEHGAFLDELVVPCDGFVLLDLHNLYCQSRNFNVSLLDLALRYPLARVRELHVSGGSWSESAAEPERGPVRRDTHDGAVPEEIFAALPEILNFCPQVRAVILERLGGTLGDPEEAESFRNDYRRLCSALAGAAP